jgi:hypothetical protein
MLQPDRVQDLLLTNAQTLAPNKKRSQAGPLTSGKQAGVLPALAAATGLFAVTSYSSKTLGADAHERSPQSKSCFLV